MNPNKLLKNKSVKCFLCSNYDNTTSVCAVRKLKLKPRSKRRCDSFVPDHTKIDKELNKGSNIEKHKRPEWYFMTRNERKKYAAKLETKRLLEEAKLNEEHPLTGALGNIVSTAAD